ncbi:MAG: hypothetical protein DWQ06_13800 [Calditrichaeota bacterium]|nr:MAG: hypothetical protein DWQ06_13800 [Calditrichota bacterium]
MDKLRDIARLIKKKKFKTLNTFFDKPIHETNTQKLFEGVIEEKYKTDSQASFDIFGAKVPDERYRKLKSNVKEQMLDTLMNLDISVGASERLKATYKCEKSLFIAKMLSKNGSYLASYDILKRNISLAKTYKMTSVILNCLEIFLNYYSITGDKKKILETFKEINFFKEVYFAELQANEYFHTISIKFINSKSLKPNLAEEANKYSEEISKNLKKFKRYNSLVLNTIYFKIKSASFEVKGDFGKALAVYNQAEKYFLRNEKIISPFLVTQFLLSKLNCYVFLQDYKNGMYVGERIAQLLPNSSLNYIFFLFDYFLLTVQSKKLTHSLKILEEINSHEKFEIFFEEEREILIILYHYLIFALLTDKDESLVKKGIKLREELDVSLQIEKIKNLTQDKKGLNVAILIIKLLFCLLDKDYSKAMDKIENLRQYAFRYLRKNDYFRMDCFIRMLILIDSGDFDFQVVEAKGEQLLKKLKGFRTSSSNSFLNWEIIPYEELWKKTIELLKKNKSSSMS